MPAPPFTIKERTRPNTTIVLMERALPYPPYELDGEHRIEVTNPAGSPIAVSTMTGPKENETTISGYWKDKFIAGGVSVSSTNGTYKPDSVADVVNEMDGIRLRGQQVEVTWGYTVRVGHLKRFTQKWHNIHDVEWSATFVWLSRGEPEVMDFTLDETASLSGVNMTLGRLLDDARDAIKDLQSKIALSLEAIDEFNAAMQKLADLGSIVESFATTIIDTATLPVDIANRMSATLSGMASVAGNLVDRLNSRMPESWRYDFTSTDIGLFLDRLTATSHAENVILNTGINNIKSKFRDIQFEAGALQRNLSEQNQVDLIGQHVAREGEDLRDVSRTYYDTPYEWQRLLVYNGLDTSELHAGQIVLVPRINGPLRG